MTCNRRPIICWEEEKSINANGHCFTTCVGNSHYFNWVQIHTVKESYWGRFIKIAFFCGLGLLSMSCSAKFVIIPKLFYDNLLLLSVIIIYIVFSLHYPCTYMTLHIPYIQNNSLRVPFPLLILWRMIAFLNLWPLH